MKKKPVNRMVASVGSQIGKRSKKPSDLKKGDKRKWIKDRVEVICDPFLIDGVEWIGVKVAGFERPVFLTPDALKEIK